MARLRNIKPGFFVDDRMADLEPLTRLLMAGLPTIADREGRLEDRPRRIKAEVLPYDDCCPEDMLRTLQTAGLIVQYTVDTVHYIAICGWHDDQRPHTREAESTIPAPPSDMDTGKAMPEHDLGDDEPGGNLELGTGNLELGTGNLELGTGVKNLRPSPAMDTTDSPVQTPETDSTFDEFWAVYLPLNNKRKDRAVVRWAKLSAAEQAAAIDAARKMSALPDQGVGPELAFIPLAATFLGHQRWLDWEDGCTPSDWSPTGEWLPGPTGNDPEPVAADARSRPVTRDAVDHDFTRIFAPPAPADDDAVDGEAVDITDELVER
jgi:hypothetical protein